MICEFCQYEFDDSCGRYGCPNCLGEGLEAHSGHRERMMKNIYKFDNGAVAQVLYRNSGSIIRIWGGSGYSEYKADDSLDVIRKLAEIGEIEFKVS